MEKRKPIDFDKLSPSEQAVYAILVVACVCDLAKTTSEIVQKGIENKGGKS